MLVIADFTAIEQGVHSLADVAGSESQAGGSHPIRSNLNFRVPQVETRNGAHLRAGEQLHGLTEDSTSELYETRQIRTGNVHINGAGPDFSAPFGGYKQSGNGREWGVEGFEEFLETKAMMGAA